MLELAGIIILGIFSQWLAWKIRVPAILPLLLTGLLMGPLSTLWSADGSKWIEPIFNPETGNGLFPGKSLFYFVSLAIGIILFEGGLTLKWREIDKVGPVILRLITLGSLVTFIGAGLGTKMIMGLSWPISFLFAGLIIVTGPTVIVPILQNVPLNRNVATVLKWEGILIDPLGALVAVLVFEFIRSAEGGVAFSSVALVTFIKIVLTGIGLGFLFGYGVNRLVKSDLMPHYLLNVVVLASVLCVFVLSDLLAHESGLLSVVVMGMVLGNLGAPRIREVLSFKESLSVLLVSILFILLASNIDMRELRLIFTDWRSLILFGFVIFVLRPLGVMLSTYRSDLALPEKIFISWMGPRGIVAAGVSSLFGITLTNDGVPGAEYITPLVFLIVLGTVLLNAASARPVANLLGVCQSSSDGVLFVGANPAARLMAKYLQENGRHVVLVDSSKGSVELAKEMKLEAFQVDIFSDELQDHFELLDMGYIVAMTGNSEVNAYAMRRYNRIFGEKGSYRLITPEELRQDKSLLPSQQLLSYTDDFLNLNEVARDFPEIHEIDLETPEQLLQLLKGMSVIRNSIPIFVKKASSELEIIPADPMTLEIEGPFRLVYLGRQLEGSMVEDLPVLSIGRAQGPFTEIK